MQVLMQDTRGRTKVSLRDVTILRDVTGNLYASDLHAMVLRRGLCRTNKKLKVLKTRRRTVAVRQDVVSLSQDEFAAEWMPHEIGDK